MNSPSRFSLIVAFVVALFLPKIARAEDPAACAEDWKKKVYFSARDSVVSIETVGFSLDHFEPIAGVVYPDRSHVVAISNAAGIGRGVRVRFASGKEISAEPVAFDEDRHVTILKLAEEAPAPALRVVDRPLEVGKELVAVSPFEGVSVTDPDATALDAKLHVGHVATAGDRTLLRLDATVPETVGAPLFDCTGDVVALRGWGAILAAHEILAVMPAAASDKPVDVKRWSAVHFHLGMLGQAGDGPRGRLGLSTGLAIVQGDRWQVRLGLGALGSLPTDSDNAARARGERISGARLQAEPTVGYRILLTKGVPTYLVPQVGVVGRVDITAKTTTEYLIPDAGCVARGGPCKVEPNSQTSSGASASIAPVVGASFMMPLVSLGYQLQLDLVDPARSTHQIFFGLEF